MSLFGRQMHLGVFVLGTGNHSAGWRYEGAATSNNELSVIQGIARQAERGKFDLVFVSDGLVMDPGDHPSFLCRFEPTSLISALNLTTSRIGLGATVSTSFGEAYHVARAVASIDHISKGRAAWNVVTTSAGRRPARRVSAVIPRPRINLVFHHGVLAPTSGWRTRVVLYGAPAAEAPVVASAAFEPGDAPPTPLVGRCWVWADLIRRAFDIDVLACARCGGSLRLIATAEDADGIRAILGCSPRQRSSWAEPPPAPGLNASPAAATGA